MSARGGADCGRRFPWVIKVQLNAPTCDAA
jgi:hypothetical protein